MRNLRKSHASHLWLNKSSKTKKSHANTLSLLINRAAVQLPYHLKGTFEKNQNSVTKAKLLTLKIKSVHRTMEI